MAITYVGGLTAGITAISSATQSISLTSLGLVAGDLVLVSYCLSTVSSDANLSAKISTTGYTQVTELFANDTNAANMAVFRKFMGTTPDSSLVVVGKNTTAQGCTVVISVFRGVNTAVPLDVKTTTAVGIDTGKANPAAITPAKAGNVIAIFASSATSLTLRTYTTASTAYMSGFQQTNNAGSTLGNTSGSGYITGQSAGISYDPAAWAISTDSTNNSWNAATLVLRPLVIADGSTTLLGTGSLAGLGVGNKQTSSAFSGVGNLTASSIKAFLGSSLFLGVSSISSLGGLLRASTVSLGGSSILTGGSLRTRPVSTALNGVGSSSVLVIKRKSAVFTGFNSEATRTTNLGDVRVTEDGNIRVTFPVIYNEAEATLTASSEKTQFNALAYVKQNGVWKRMVPNVKHSNIWQEAHRMYKKISDNWKRIY